MNIKTTGLYLASNIAAMGIAAGGIKAYSKMTGKQVGVPGSIGHIITNDKIENKAKVFLEQTKEGIKDTLTLGGITAGAGVAGSLVVGNSKKCANAFEKLLYKTSTILENSSFNGKNVKDLIKNTSIFKKFSALPAPAKAGILAAGAALALIAPIIQSISAQKAGYIEGKSEGNV